MCTQKIGKEWNGEIEPGGNLAGGGGGNHRGGGGGNLAVGGGGNHRGGKQQLWQPGRGTWGHLPDLISDLSMIKFFELE